MMAAPIRNPRGPLLAKGSLYDDRLMGLSQRIVDFVGHLLPLYVQEEVNGKWCARSLEDGTLVLSVEEDEDDKTRD